MSLSVRKQPAPLQLKGYVEKLPDGEEVEVDGILMKRTSKLVQKMIFTEFSHLLVSVTKTDDGIIEEWSSFDGNHLVGVNWEVVEIMRKYQITVKYDCFYAINGVGFPDPGTLYYDPENLFTPEEYTPSQRNQLVFLEDRVYKTEDPNSESVSYHFDPLYSEIVVKGIEKDSSGFYMEKFGQDLHKVEPEIVLKRAMDILKLLSRLHELGVYHRDFHPGNILFNGKTFRLIDLEFSTTEETEECFHSHAYVPFVDYSPGRDYHGWLTTVLSRLFIELPHVWTNMDKLKQLLPDPNTLTKEKAIEAFRQLRYRKDWIITRSFEKNEISRFLSEQTGN